MTWRRTTAGLLVPAAAGAIALVTMGMTKPIKHTKVSAKSDDSDTSLVLPSDWNATHEGVQTFRTTGDITNATTTLASATGLSFAIAASEVWHIHGVFWYTSSSTSAGIQLGISGPASPTAVIILAECQTSATAWTTGTVTTFGSKVPGTAGAASSTSTTWAVDFAATIENGANAGTIQIQFCASTTGTITFKRGSHISIFKD